MPWLPLPGPRDKPPAPMAGALDRLMRNMGGPRADTVKSVFERWEEIVGEGLAAHATPVALRNGCLVLSVPDPAWASQLRFFEGEILTKLAEAFGPKEVLAIEVRVRAPDKRRR